MKTDFPTILLIFIAFYSIKFAKKQHSGLTVLTIAHKNRGSNSASGDSDSLDRFKRSAQVHGVRVKVLRNSVEDDDQYAVTSVVSKIILLWTELTIGGNYLDDDVIIFMESHDVLLLGKADEILNRFLQFGSKGEVTLLSVDSSCSNSHSVGQTRTSSDTDDDNKGGRCNRGIGGFIGYKSKIVSLLDKIVVKNIQNNDNNQQEPMISTIMYKAAVDLPENFDLWVKLDLNSSLFHSLNENNYSHPASSSSSSKLKLVMTETGTFLMDTGLNTKVLILHGQGSYSSGQKLGLNQYENYLMDDWRSGTPCGACLEDTISLENIPNENLPRIAMAIFIDKPTPFLEEFFIKIERLDYPKSRIQIFIHNRVPYHENIVQNFVFKWSTTYSKLFKSSTNSSGDPPKNWETRNLAMNFALREKSDYFFSIDSLAHLDNPKTLRRLIEQNRGIVAPLLVQPRHKLVSNFWAALDLQGFYDTSMDYVAIIKGKLRGVWNVPFISGAYLIHPKIIWNDALRPNYSSENFQNPAQAFSAHSRHNGLFLYLSNREDFGHLVNPVEYQARPSSPRNELYDYFNNKLNWESRYMHPDYFKYLNSSLPPFEPCPDVFSFPIVTERFCRELIEEMELNGNWSADNNYDVDPAPTVDIGLDQIDLEFQWMDFIRLYVLPLQKLVYPGYNSERPYLKWDTPYVIRYEPNGRTPKPHHDLSTFTINIALNKAGIDFEGGGVRFNRYNCNVLDNRPGWLLLHPGQLTHQHQGLMVTKGKRYVLITFIEPH